MGEMDLGFIAVILCIRTMKESIIFTKMSAELKRIITFLTNGVKGQM